MKYGIIYKITNKINGKVYIGKTVQRFEARCKAHRYKSCRAFNNAIISHGWDNFEKEEFICALNEDHLASLEEMTINFHNSLTPNGYNLVKIDNGLNRYSDEIKKKISESRITFYKNLETPIIPKNRKLSINIDGIESKDCNECKLLKPMTDFALAKTRWDGRAAVCKKCHHEKYNSKPDPRRLTPEQFQESYKGRQDINKQRQPYIDNPEFKLRSSKATSKAIMATNIETGEILEFKSALKASGFNNSRISTAIKNKTIYKKHTWRFK